MAQRALKSKDKFLKLKYEIWEEIRPLPPMEKLLYIYLLERYGFYGGKEFFRSDEQIMKDLGISRETLRRSRTRLEKRRVIGYQKGISKRQASKYTVTRLENDSIPPQNEASSRLKTRQDIYREDKRRRYKEDRKKIEGAGSAPACQSQASPAYNNYVQGYVGKILSENDIKALLLFPGAECALRHALTNGTIALEEGLSIEKAKGE